MDWKGVVRGVAPAIATALAGPQVGKALAVLSTALLGKPDASEQEVAAALAAPLTADQELALKMADNDFVLALLDRSNRADELESQDRASARAMQMAMHSNVPEICTYIVLGLFAIEIALSHFYPVPSGNRDTVAQNVGVLNIAVGTALGFWLGGSFGSRTKDFMGFLKGGHA